MKILLFGHIADTVVDGNFQWVQGSNMGYTNWNDGQPQDTVGQEDCGSIFTGRIILNTQMYLKKILWVLIYKTL